MAVELLRYHNFDQQTAIREATSAGLISMDYINRHLDCREITDLTVSKFSKVISALNRTGHARFRRAPVLLRQTQSPPLNPAQCSIQASGSNQLQTLNMCSVSPASEAERDPATAVLPLKIVVIDNEALSLSSAKRDPPPPVQPLKIDVIDKKALSLSAAVTTSGNSSSTVVSTITGDGSVSNGKGRLPSTFLAPVISSGKPPLSGKRYREHAHNITGKTSGSSPCHCKKRKHLMKRTIRVPSISSKVADIPPDENSWRKYGQKPVNGSSYPRGYYKCSTVMGCPARKHVERANDDPTMLIVTYEGEHRHSQAAKQEITAAWAGSRVSQLKLAKF